MLRVSERCLVNRPYRALSSLSGRASDTSGMQKCKTLYAQQAMRQERRGAKKRRNVMKAEQDKAGLMKNRGAKGYG